MMMKTTVADFNMRKIGCCFISEEEEVEVSEGSGGRIASVPVATTQTTSL